MMDRRTFVAITGRRPARVVPQSAGPGQARTRRIGFLSAFARADIEAFLSLLRPELEKLGWTDGRNIVLLEPRTTDGARTIACPPLAAELVSQVPT